MGIKVVNISQYMGGYIGETGDQEMWLGKKVIVWEVEVHMLEGVARRHPKASYAGIKISSNRSGIFLFAPPP